MTARARAAAALAGAALTLGLCSCAQLGPTPSRAADGGPAGVLRVLAASSLTESFELIAEAFEDEHPQIRVALSFGGSSRLAQQVRAGAPADVFAAASPESMTVVTASGDASGEPRLFARNRLEIAVPRGNPGAVTGLADLADPARTVALCAPQVPCGALAERVLGAAGVVGAPDTLEGDVRAAMAKVRLGEVDAALVYRTDVLAARGAVDGIPFPEAALAANGYLVAVLVDARDPAVAGAFAAFLFSPRAQGMLADAGFEIP